MRFDFVSFLLIIAMSLLLAAPVTDFAVWIGFPESEKDEICLVFFFLGVLIAVFTGFNFYKWAEGD